MKLTKKRVLAAAIIAGLTTPMLAQATNGYFMIGFGAKSRGMGGVGVAEGVDGLAAAFNPATMADVGTRFDIGGDIFWAPNTVTHSDGTLSETTIVESSHFEESFFSPGDFFLIPNMGGTYKYSEEITLGFAFIGAGMGTQYNQALPEGNSSYFFNFNGLAESDKVGIKLMQAQIPLSVSYKVNETHTVGASFVIAAQIFEAWGLKAFQELNLAASNTNLSEMGTDVSFGAGLRFGWTGKYLDDDLRFGFNYSSRTYMSEFDDYSSLFAEHGDFDIPENYTIGLAYNINPKAKVKFDIQQINYSDIDSVGNPGPYAYNSEEFNPLCPGTDSDECKIGGDLGMGFGWSDQTIYKLGTEYQYNDALVVRAGFNYGKSTIKGDQIIFNLLAPATIESHLTLGATYNFSDDIELSMSYVHGFENTQTGQTLFQPLGSNPDVTTDNAAISMKQRSLGASLGIKW